MALLRPGRAWEGEGDVLRCGERVFAGHGCRSEPAALDALDAMLGTTATRLELADPRFYHLDTCFLPLSDQFAAYVPGAFTDAARETLRGAFTDLFEVPEHDALRFACNALPVDDTVVLNTECAALTAALRARAYRCVETPTSEFIKAGGSIKCLVLTLDGPTAFAPPA